jgi:hypothetical protein
MICQRMAGLESRSHLICGGEAYLCTNVLRFCRAHWLMLVSGATNVLPSSVNEYSTPRPFDPVRSVATNPVDSRLREFW